MIGMRRDGGARHAERAEPARCRSRSPRAGQLIAAGALVMCFGAPLLAALVAGWDRRRLLALSPCSGMPPAHLPGALMPSFGSLLPVRVLAVLAPAVFTPQAAACVGLLVPPEQRGRAITFIFLGWSVASVLGMPIGAWSAAPSAGAAPSALVAVLSARRARPGCGAAMPDGVQAGGAVAAPPGAALRRARC